MPTERGTCDEEIAKSDGYVTFRVQVCMFGDGCVLVAPSRGDVRMACSRLPRLVLADTSACTARGPFQ